MFATILAVALVGQRGLDDYSGFLDRAIQNGPVYSDVLGSLQENPYPRTLPMPRGRSYSVDRYNVTPPRYIRYQGRYSPSPMRPNRPTGIGIRKSK